MLNLHFDPAGNWLPWTGNGCKTFPLDHRSLFPCFVLGCWPYLLLFEQILQYYSTRHVRGVGGKVLSWGTLYIPLNIGRQIDVQIMSVFGLTVHD